MLKVTSNSRYVRSEREINELMRTPCPVCGKPSTPFMYEDWFSRTYHYHCDSDYDIDVEGKLTVVTTPGCNSKWIVKVSRKELKELRHRGQCPGVFSSYKHNIFMRTYLKVLKKLEGRED